MENRTIIKRTVPLKSSDADEVPTPIETVLPIGTSASLASIVTTASSVSNSKKQKKRGFFHNHSESAQLQQLNNGEYDNLPTGNGEYDSFPPLERRETNEVSVVSSHLSSGDEEGGKIKSLFGGGRRKSFTEEELEKIPRLVHRNLPFKQSRQEIAVVNKSVFKTLKLQRIISQDWYHVLLRWNTCLSVLFLLTIWTLSIVIFALIYMHVDARNPMVGCGLGKEGEPIGFSPAFAFSLETCTTVGYGLPNSTNGFFEAQCRDLQVAIYFQMTFSMLFNAFLFAFLFAGLARCEQRGSQVLFSDKAIIEKRNGRWLMHVRLYDYGASQPVVEAHVRMYCVSWRDYEKQTRDLHQPHLLHTMRVLQPNDELGATLFTSIPSNLTHEIDVYSPLISRQFQKDSRRTQSGGIPLRAVDQRINGCGIMCPSCGEAYGSLKQLRKHIRYNSIVESLDDNFPMIGSHRDPDLVTSVLEEPKGITENDIREHLKDKEIMVVVEGIEPMVSGTFQALQSYKIKDIVFGGRFAPCMSQAGGKIFVDVDKFHTVLPPSEESVRKMTISYSSDRR
mmetsp:Transcript_13326/g.16204  ORF Transcript_13326/g.16204 Transcript_13326/m.16204 type:complete len:563 (+) Transcript_13326:117-1805(+)